MTRNVISFTVVVLTILNYSSSKDVILNSKDGFSSFWGRDGLCDASWVWENGVWSTCLPSRDSQDCLLISDFYPILNANLVYVNVSLSVTTCASLRVKKPGTKCNNFFKLKVYTGAKQNQAKAYTFISNLPSVAVPDTIVPEFVRSVETAVINDVAGKEGIIFQFQTNFFCGIIDRVVVYYKECPAETTSLEIFKAQPAPAQKSSTVAGTCTTNSVPKSQSLSRECRYDGTYTITGECVCDKGYTKVGNQCQACKYFEYKPSVGNNACFKCGKNSRNEANPKLTCNCRYQYFREIGKKTDPKSDCYRPPDAPMNIVLVNKQSDSVFLSWQQPQESGSSPLGIYVVECKNCPTNKKFRVLTDTLSVNITGLSAYTYYIVDIYNENNVTKLTGERFPIEFQFRTEVPTLRCNLIHTCASSQLCFSMDITVEKNVDGSYMQCEDLDIRVNCETSICKQIKSKLPPRSNLKGCEATCCHCNSDKSVTSSFMLSFVTVIWLTKLFFY